MAKKCRTCKQPFKPFNSLQTTCTIACALTQATTQRIKEEKRNANKQAKAERKKHREAKERIKTRSQHLREAQAAFNKWIRLRDHDKGCICCNNRRYEGQYHAGHYLSVGACPELRFEEDNCHKQKSSCNDWKSGNQVNYRKYLIRKIGLDRVEWLEGPHEPKKYTIEGIKAIKVKYRKMARDLEKEISEV